MLSTKATTSTLPSNNDSVNSKNMSTMSDDQQIPLPSVTATEQHALDDLAELRDLEQVLFMEYTTNFQTKLKRIWAYALGTSAFIELLSFVIPYLFLESVDEMAELEHNLRPRLLFFLPKKWCLISEELVEEESQSVVQWLDDNCYPIGLVFNCLWTIHSFVAATRVRRQALRGLEKKILLKGKHNVGASASSTSASSATADVDNSMSAEDDNANTPTKKKKKRRIKALREDFAMKVYAIGGSWNVFFVMLAWMLLLLPVGYFIRIAHEIKTYAGYDISVEQALDEETMEQLHVITKKTKYCLGYAVLLRVYTIASISVAVRIKDEKRILTRRLAKFLGKFAIRHPVTFRRRLRKTLTALRWIKYLAPLVGQGNKLIGQLKTLRKRHKQKKDAEKAKKVKKLLWKQLAPEDRRQTAAVMLQGNYRGHKSRQAYKAMLQVRVQRREAAVLKIQNKLRQKAAQARVNVLKKKQELRTLQMQQYGASKMRRKVARLDIEAKRRLYQLEEELAIEVQDLKWRKMLLRPNTNFAVTWRVLFVVCVILEITHLALEPRVAQHRDATTGKKLNVGMVMEHYLVPEPISEWPQCEGAVDLIGEEHIPRRPQKKSQKKRKDKAIPPPWYCYRPYATIQESFVYFLRYLIKDLLVIISVICFMDVFVTFFTGEICSDTGALKPKPFMVRWLLPGLMLQVLVNPKMAEVSSAIKRLWAGIHHIGPARVWRWTVVLIEPAFFAFYGWYERNVWTKMVVVENAKAKQVD